MKKWLFFRTTLIIVSFGIFVFQSCVAFIKFTKSPTVIEKHQLSWDDLEDKPRIDHFQIYTFKIKTE